VTSCVIQCVRGEVLLTLRFGWLLVMPTLTEAERQRADAALAELATRSQQLSDADDALVELQRASKRREAKQAMHIRRLEQQVLQLESQLAESNAARSLLEEQLATSQTESQDRRHCERMMLKFVELGFKLKRKASETRSQQRDPIMIFGGSVVSDATSNNSSLACVDKTRSTGDVGEMSRPFKAEQAEFSFCPSAFSQFLSSEKGGHTGAVCKHILRDDFYFDPPPSQLTGESPTAVKQGDQDETQW